MKYLAHGYAAAHLSGDEKPSRIIHPECRETFSGQANKLRLLWVNSYHVDAPFDVVSRFALCAQCGQAIRK